MARKRPDLAVATGATWPYEFAVVPLRSLFVDATYQRPLSRFHKRIVEALEPALVGTLIVNKRSDRGPANHAVIDGQTRLAALMQLGHVNAPCLVYQGLSLEEEAALFARFQSERRNVTAVQRFKAALVAGEERAIGIQLAADSAGFVIDAHNNYGNSLVAVKALEEVYDRHGLYHVAQVLETIAAAWQHRRRGQSQEMLRGLSYFLARTPDLDVERLIRGLSSVEPGVLSTRAEQLRQGRGRAGSSPSYMAEAIAAVYGRRFGAMLGAAEPAGQMRGRGVNRRAILEALSDGAVRSVPWLQGETDIEHSTLNTTLSQMRAAGQIVSAGRALWRLAADQVAA